MTASEFSFLALGLVLGLVSGAALVEFLRARSSSSPQVKVTVSPDSVPRRRASTLADAFLAVDPARGGPADRRTSAGEPPPGMPERRTSVPVEDPASRLVADGSQSTGGPGGTTTVDGRSSGPRGPSEPPSSTGPPTGVSGSAAGRTIAVGAAEAVAGTPDTRVGIPISTGVDPTFGALRAGAAAGAAVAVSRERGEPGSVAAVKAPPAPAPVASEGSPRAATARAAAGEAAAVDAGPCAAERRIAEERCEVAVRARARADAAADAVRAAQRMHDGHESAITAASEIADPRAVQAAKEEAQATFRAAVSVAKTPDAHETAARSWLNEVNRINRSVRDANSTLARERAAAREVGVRLERLELEADAARIAAANADAACLAARSAVAECDERSAPVLSSTLIPPVAGAPGRINGDQEETLEIALEAGGQPIIFRLLNGDRAAMQVVVRSLAGDDADRRRHWQLLITRLLEAIMAEAIEASALELPDVHPFWGMFTRLERREVAKGLSSLGYRFDGLGGWADGRQPSKRDLSLALGYAGLDPMRVRQWPNEKAIEDLFADATVTADEYLATYAGDLTLAEMVTMLGRRADGLAEAWNAWGRIRPLLLSET